MSVWEAAVLGTVQGLTEFLPVSSSGHLVMAEALLGLSLPGIVFEVSVHVATLCAVLWAYRERVLELAGGLAGGAREAWVYVGLLALASLPAGAAGLMGRSWFEQAFDAPPQAAALLLVSGLLAWSLRFTRPAATDPRPGPGRALAVGVAQAVAILPGVSRSGATVATGAWLGVDAVRMAEFSFLLSVPAIGGAAALQVGELGSVRAAVGAWPLAVGFGTALVSGVLAIRLFVRMLERHTFHRFGYYCWAVGLTYLGAAALFPPLRGGG